MNKKRELAGNQITELMEMLQARFANNMKRHKDFVWNDVQAKLQLNLEKLWSLNEMERTGGEPDLVGYDKESGEYIFYDCAVESPFGRRNVCYDSAALVARKKDKPEHSAVEFAMEMGMELLTEEEYRKLQGLGDFDQKTSSWLQTPAAIRKLGGAIFGDKRYGRVFVYHNGVSSYYGVRGFRGSLRV